MVISPDAQRTTVVTLPAVSAPMLQDLVQRMLADVPPEQRQRVRRGVSTLLSSTIIEAGRTGVDFVESSQEPGHYHTASSFTCSGADVTRRRVTWRHSYAIALLNAMSGAARFETCQARLTAKGEVVAAAVA